MTKSANVLLGLALVGLAPWLASPLKAAETKSALLTFPGDATLVLQVKDTSQLVDKIQKSPPFQLKDHGDFAELMAKANEQLAEIQNEVRAELDIDIWETLASIQGEVLVLLGEPSTLLGSVKAIGEALDRENDTSLDAEGRAQVQKAASAGFESLPFLVVADGANEFGKLKAVLEKVKGYLAKKGAKVEVTKFHGGEVNALLKEDAGHFYVGELGTRLLLGFNRKLIEQTMVHLSEGTQGGITSNAIFQRTRQHAKGDSSDFFVYLNVRGVTAAVGPLLGPGMEGMIWESVNGLIFGNSLNSLGLGGAIGEKNLRHTLFVDNDGASDGILGWFKGGEFPAEPPTLVPDDSATFSSVAFNGGNFTNFVNGVLQIVSSFQGQKPEDMKAMAKQFIGADVDDILRSLGSRIHFFGTATAPGGVENPFGDQTIVFELKEDGPLKTVLETVSVMAQLTTKEYLGRTLYQAPSSAGSAVSLCVTDQKFLLAFAEGALEKVVRRLGKDVAGIGEKPEFKSLAAGLPAQVSALSYTDSTYFGDYLSNMAAMVMENAPDQVPQELFLLMTAVGRTLGSSIGFGQWNETGMYTESTLQFQTAPK